jgi:catechol 2,3-dioxygenase-like lactoylglutathione lyase family enzyme
MWPTTTTFREFSIMPTATDIGLSLASGILEAHQGNTGVTGSNRKPGECETMREGATRVNEANTTGLLGELGFIFLEVPDIKAARAFYVDTLGMVLEDETPAFLQVGRPGGAGATLGIGLGETSRALPGVVWWVVNDTDAVHAALVERGVRIVSAPQDMPFGRTCSFADPAGNILNIYKPR